MFSKIIITLTALLGLTSAGPITAAACYATCAASCGLAGVAITPAGGAVCYAAC